MEALRLSTSSGRDITGVISVFALPLSSCLVPPPRGKPAAIHGIPAKGAKMDARCANCERHLAFLPSCASLYCEQPDDAPAVARCFAGAFGREPKGEPR